MNQYTGSYGYGRIGSMSISSETSQRTILSHISEVLMNKMRNERKANGTQFIIETYVTKDHGEFESIKDTNGKVYGFDHGSCSGWGWK